MFNQGLDIVEVSDDGCGVPVDSRHLLATPHATSKIQSFDDIYSSTTSNTTLGFRGEALFCLANLSGNLVVATRTADEAVAQKLEYRRDGSLRVDSVTRVPKKVGTTVAVVRLLEAVPVRRADLKRRIGEQRRKLVKLISGYAILAPAVRFQLIDITTANNKGRKSQSSAAAPREHVLLATPGQGPQKLPEAISAVFGSAFWNSLTEFHLDLTKLIADAPKTSTDSQQNDNHNSKEPQHSTPSASSPSASSLAAATPLESPKWQVRGYISKCPSSSSFTNHPSSALSSNERRFRDEQLYSINQRPVDMPRVTRMLMTVWKSLQTPSTAQRRSHPSCILEFTLPNHAYDVNVSPDKREVILPQESQLLDLLQHHVQQVWSAMDGHFDSAPRLVVVPPPPAQLSSLTHPEDDPDDEQEEEEVDTPTKFNRRYAFSHDVRKIRLQHEYDDGRIRSSEEKWEPRTSLSSSAESHEEDDAVQVLVSTETKTPEHRNGGVPQKEKSENEQEPCETDTMDTSVPKQSQADASATKPTKTCAQVTPISAERVPISVEDQKLAQTPLLPEKRKLRATTSNPHELSPTQEDRLWRAAKRRFHDSSRVEAQLATHESFAQFRATTGGPRSKPQRPTPHSQNKLEQFGFSATSNQRKEKDRCVNDDRLSHRETNATDGGPSCKRVSFDSAPTLDSEGPTDDTTKTRPGPHADHIVTVEERKPIPHFEQGNHNTVVSSQEGEPSVSSVQDPNQRCEPNGNEPVAPARRDSISRDSVVWESFYNTSTVLEAARKERIAMLDRRISLQSDDEVGRNNVEPGEGEDGSKISLQQGDFGTMVVIGQFNMGFILAKSAENHLWIMDQHACDEVYNFEKLVAETVIHEQPLMAPSPLELSVEEESCVLDNMDIFEKNGFRFQYQADKPPRFRLSLTAIPHSGARDGRKAVQFGRDDVAALCAILGADDTGTSSFDTAAGGGTGTDGSGMYGNNAVRRYASQRSDKNIKGDDADRVIARLPKAIAMFASRACRGSIMIGKALSSGEMDRVVKHLGEIEQPWNCPHGRPTMRHAADLRLLMSEDERHVAARLAGSTVTIMSQEMESQEDQVGLTQDMPT